MSFPASNNVNASGFRFLATKANCRPDCSTLPVEEDHCNHRPSSLSQTREICFSSDRSRQLCQMSTRWTRRSWAFEARGLESRRYNNTQLGQWGKNGDLKGKSKGSPFISEPRSIDRWNVWKGLLAKKDRLCYKCFLCTSQCVQFVKFSFVEQFTSFFGRDGVRLGSVSEILRYLLFYFDP